MCAPRAKVSRESLFRSSTSPSRTDGSTCVCSRPSRTSGTKPPRLATARRPRRRAGPGTRSRESGPDARAIRRVTMNDIGIGDLIRGRLHRGEVCGRVVARSPPTPSTSPAAPGYRARARIPTPGRRHEAIGQAPHHPMGKPPPGTVNVHGPARRRGTDPSARERERGTDRLWAGQARPPTQEGSPPIGALRSPRRGRHRRRTESGDGGEPAAKARPERRLLKPIRRPPDDHETQIRGAGTRRRGRGGVRTKTPNRAGGAGAGTGGRTRGRTRGRIPPLYRDRGTGRPPAPRPGHPDRPTKNRWQPTTKP